MIGIGGEPRQEGRSPEPLALDQLAVLPSKDAVLYPLMLLPLAVSEQRWVKLIGEAASGHQPLGLFLQKSEELGEPGPDDLYSVGTAASLVRMLKQPDGSVQVLLQGVARIRITEVIQTEPHLVVRVQQLEEQATPSLELDALVKNLLGLFQLGTLPADLTRRNMELFAREVMPALKAVAHAPLPAPLTVSG